MAITVTAVNVTGPRSAQIATAPTAVWQLNATSADASGCEEIKATPGAGYNLCLERLIIACGAAVTVTIGSGAAAGAVETIAIGPVGGAVGTYAFDFRDRPLLLVANKALTVDASGAGDICIWVEGFTRAA